MSKLPKLFVVVLAIVVGFLSPVQAQEANKDTLGAMRYRYIGPVGNRVTSVVSVPGSAGILLATSAKTAEDRSKAPSWPLATDH